MKTKDPRDFDWDKNSPYEIYAAGRWLGTRDDPAWQARARLWAEQNSPVYRGELNDYSESPLILVRELFFLHLTVRIETPQIIKALTLLKSFDTPAVTPAEVLDDIPFEPADDPYFISHAWLFNAAVFGQTAAHLWRETAEEAGERIVIEGESLSSCSLYNFLRGVLITPDAVSINGVADALRLLALRQESSGFFKDIAPWQIYNLAAHSNLSDALKIIDRLEPPLLKLQNPDGSWAAGRQKALASFLMAHGLQNRWTASE